MADGSTPPPAPRCDACDVAEARAAARGGLVGCVCGRWYGPQGPARPPALPAASLFIPRVPELLPQLVGRAICLEPERAPAREEDPDPARASAREQDAERRRRGTLVAYARLRALARGDAAAQAAAALLWTAHALTPPVIQRGRPVGGPLQHAAACRSVALGAAPSVARQEWRWRAADRDRTKDYVSTLVLPDGFEEVDGRRQPKYREVPRKSTLIVSVRGPAVEASAAAWGRERLAPLWSPGDAPEELALAAALGWAPPKPRAAWEALRGAVKEAAVTAWGGRALAAADAVWRDERGATAALALALGIPGPNG